MSGEKFSGVNSVEIKVGDRPTNVVSQRIGSVVMRGDTPFDGGFGYDTEMETDGKVMAFPTVPYAGTELPYTIHVRQAPDEFMLRKPA